jgi:superfamily II DNA or RNA helicase
MIELNETLLAKAAGWEVIKQARQMLALNRVLSSNWTEPILKGVVLSGTTSYRAGLVIQGPIDIENLCSCRASREAGIICAHSVAVGLHWLRPAQAPDPAPAPPAAARAETGTPGRTSPAAPLRDPAAALRRAAPGTPGEPLEVSVVFPPNLAEGLLRNRVTVLFEGKWSRGRIPLSALPKHIAFALEPEDLRLLDAAESLTAGEAPGSLQLPSSAFAVLLKGMQGHPRLSLARRTPVRVLEEPWRPGVEASLQANGTILLRPAVGGAPPVMVAGESLWAFEGDAFRPVLLAPGVGALLQGRVEIPRSQVPAFISCEWPALQAACVVKSDFEPSDFTLEPEAPRFLLSLDGGLAQLQGTLTCRYGASLLTPEVTAGDASAWMPDPDRPRRYTMRDLAAEQGALDRLRRAGFSGPGPQGRLSLVGERHVVAFLAREFPRLEKEWTVTLEERLERSTEKHFERLEPAVRITPSGERWFDLELSVTTRDGERFSASDVQRLILSGQGSTRLRNGKIALINTEALDEFQQVLRDCDPGQHAKGYRLGQGQAAYVAATLERNQGWAVNAPADWRARVKAQSGEAQLACPPLGNLDSVLRPYQKQGVAWLAFLRENGFGGILADDMGLGKTLQVLALLRSLKGAARPGPAIVVCPTSLVFNWVNEAARFTPELRVLPLDGPERHRKLDAVAGSDVIVTSYALLRRDADLYRGMEFDLVVLDEAQHIKNRETQNAQAVKSIRARQRLVLTGTPMENSVLDLWSIFDFLMPGYLGTAADFRERYEGPIVKGRDAAVQARLSRRLKPFVLRRMKREVAKELPEKIEQLSLCELTGDQAAVYAELLAAGRAQVMEAVGDQGLARSRMLVLNALLRLRQACCDLRLLKLDQVNPAQASGKLDLFDELLEEILDGGHRVLVFSQFTQMLALIRERLESQTIDYCYLDGSTRDRAAVVDRFQSDARVPVFLISLKAGGVGLNLTGADTVIHFDPWWNPAVEDQATDRAHRIGQRRVVTSYKLIARGTVEEKIVRLQARKRELIRGVLGDEQALSESLTWEEIQELLAG